MLKGEIMYKISDTTFKEALKPFDVVKVKETGSVAFISVTNVNHCQPHGHQVSYSLTFICGNDSKNAWYTADELEYQCNIFHKIMLEMHGQCGGREYLEKIVFNRRK